MLRGEDIILQAHAIRKELGANSIREAIRILEAEKKQLTEKQEVQP